MMRAGRPHHNTAKPQRWPGLILVVDDEPKLRRLLQQFLQSHGFRVAQAASGEEALALGADDYILKPVNTEYLETILLSKLLLGL